MLPFNTSAFSNALGAPDRSAQRKALIAPFKEEFDGNPEDVLRHIAAFNHRCKEAGVVEDFKFVIHENPPPSSLDLSSPDQNKAWLSDPNRFTYGNILIDSSNATIEKMQQARDVVRNSLKNFSSAPDPVKMPLASKQLVSFQNREWIYTLIQTIWSPNMKTIMQRYEELHDQDGVVLWFSFLNHFAGTNTENLIEAYSQLTESKIQLSHFQGNVLHFTNFVRAPVRRLIKAKENPSFQHFLHVFHGAMDAPNEEFRAFIIALYTDYRKGGPTQHLSMLDLLDQLDNEYNRINNLGRWVKKEDTQLLALTASLQAIHTKLSNLQGRYDALLASQTSPSLPSTLATPTPTKINKPPPRKEGEPEIIEFEGRLWKWCSKCYGGCWNRTHVTVEHQPGKGRSKQRRNPESTGTAELARSQASPAIPIANQSTVTPVTPEANTAPAPDSILDFI